MRVVSDTASQIIASRTRGVTWVADLFFNGERRAANIPVTDVKLTWDGGRQVTGAGSLSVVWSDPLGVDMSPRDLSDWFAPFGAELQVDVIVAAGRFTERVPVGRFVITSVPQTFSHSGLVTPTTVIPVELKDALHRVGRNKFAAPTPPSSISAWTEVQWLTGMPTIRNVADAVVPRTALYEDSRLDTLDDLFALMQAWPALTSQGALIARPFAWPADATPVGDVSVVTSELKSENVYNRVVVEGKGANDTIVRAIVDMPDGPLRALNFDGTPSPYGVVPYFYSSDLITTQPQAEIAAREMLQRVSKLRGVARSFSVPFNPLYEVGDVLLLAGERVRISQVEMTGIETTVTAEVVE